ncbi:wall-associated receptor kinase-like 8 isoform X8 [Quercus robur]|uniref:wall-associated receptor kinase-like 8 isoform X8 n=1 Tax=Quercus robur TaxID=38942 RepID=UPI002163AAF3|nr:wall-associated receptor kinase-like 8 isoform X8 [Quercus robur]
MAVQVVMRITFLLLLTTYELAEAAAPIAKPNCSDSCGDIYIPYPFGKTTECYLNYWFKIVCNETGGSLKAFLPSIGMEVLEIHLTDPYNNYYFWNDPGLIRLNVPIISSNCKSLSSGNIGGVDISGSPFYFSSYRDKFISVGCDNLALMTSIDPMVVVGCKSNCTDKSMIEDIKLKNCLGRKCCITTIPSGIQVLNASFRSIKEENKVSEECKYAFLADDKWLSSEDITYKVQSLEYVPVVLEWTASEFITVDSDELRRRNSEGYPTLYETKYYYCLKGYQGNPYLPTGCQDINECESKTLNKCPNKSDCVNIQGSYHCNKPKSPVKPKSPLKMAIIVICSSLGALFHFTIIWCLYRMIKKRNKIKLKKKFFKKNGGLLLQQQLSSNDNNVQKTTLFNSKELKNATDHFNKNRILGKGGQGTVYKGMLADGRIVAIKKCNTVDKGNIEKFINEIIILSQINHRNVVKLLGWCLETEVPLLVYEFIPNGTLFQYIHEEKEEFPLLTWDMRLRIAIEVAGALSYLHSAASLPIYHRDIKSSNILLDDKYRAKVADFGTSRSVAIDQTHVTTLVYGTFGYLDPEYFQTSQFTEKSDVYSFGVVLIELLTGKKPVFLTRSQEDRNLSTYFIHAVKENRLFDILDTQVRKDGNKHEVMEIANLAQRCLQLYGKKRPTMTEIVKELEGVQKVYPNQPNFEEFDYVRNEEMGPRNDTSILSRSSLEIGEPSS